MSYSSDMPALWPLMPNWKAGVQETLEFRTGVIGPSMTGLRQKRRLRTGPRRTFRFQVHPHGDSRRLLENLRFAQGMSEWALPIWHDRQRLLEDLPAGETEVPCSTIGYDFQEGRFAVLASGRPFVRKFELVRVAAVNVDSIVLEDGTESAWPASSFLLPVRLCRLAGLGDSVTLLTSNVSTQDVSLEVSEPCDWPAHEFASQYRGRPVWEFRNNWRRGREYGFSRLASVIDNGTSLPSYFDFSGEVFTSVNVDWMVRGRAENALQRAVLYALAGRYRSVWVPSLASDLVVVGSTAAASAQLHVGYCGYAAFALGREGRRDLRIELVDGSVYYRRVTGATETGETETLTLNQPLGVEVSPQNVRRVSFLMLMQQATDGTTITHHTSADGAASAPVVFEGIVEPPAE